MNLERTTQNPQLMGRKLCIRGMRVIVGQIGSGRAIDEVLADYPYLEREDIQSVHWAQVGKVDAPDTEIMTNAAPHDFVVLRHDLDFSAILAVTPGAKRRTDKLDSDVISA